MAERPDFPADALRAALPNDPEVYERIADLRDELESERPASAKIRGHVDELRKHPSLRAIVAGWFDDPRTQAFIDELTAAGL
jgi:hypothetical protein